MRGVSLLISLLVSSHSLIVLVPSANYLTLLLIDEQLFVDLGSSLLEDLQALKLIHCVQLVMILLTHIQTVQIISKLYKQRKASC